MQDDIAAIRPLMDRAIGSLMQAWLSPEQIIASSEVMGLDTQLIEDGTYFVVVEAGGLIGCGGWSRRATLFGGDHSAGRSAALLDPARDAARVRAMYTDPDHVRRGIGRAILIACEAAAAGEGFRTAELAATLAGVPLYEAAGYRAHEAFSAATSGGVQVPLVRMGKPIARRI